MAEKAKETEQTVQSLQHEKADAEERLGDSCKCACGESRQDRHFVSEEI